MESAVRIETTVLPGNRIEVSSSRLVEGDQVEVTIVNVTKSPKKRRSVLDILETTTHKPLFKSAEEVDQYLENERNSWERFNQ
jgi:antitoxin component of MazEF toxin-antitoxin module